MFETLAETLSAGLQLWLHKEKTKYIDKLIDLRRKYREEFNKSDAHRSDAVLDNLEFELRILAVTFTSAVGKPDSQNQS